MQLYHVATDDGLYVMTAPLCIIGRAMQLPREAMERIKNEAKWNGGCKLFHNNKLVLGERAHVVYTADHAAVEGFAEALKGGKL
jgi:hypothetical protein